MAYSVIDKMIAHHNSTLVTGTGSAQAITGVGHRPDFWWGKRRDNTGNGTIFNSVRGVTKGVESNTDAQEFTSTDYITAFGSDGFTTAAGSSGAGNGSSQTSVNWTWAAGGASPAITYTVKVVDDSGNKYRFNDFGTSAVTLDLQEGGTYTFDASDSSVDSHPFVIGTAANSSEYSTGVTYQLDGVSKTYSQYTSGFATATTRKLIITVAASAPALYYWCSNHSGMGGAINTNSLFGSSNFGGAVQSIASTNDTAGFSIVTYTGTGSATTVGHGLSVAPACIWLKALDTGSEHHVMYHHGMGATKVIKIRESSRAASTTSTYWNDTAPTTSAFSIGTDHGVNKSSTLYQAYCWAQIPGYSRFGRYMSNASSDGPFINMGFEPRMLIVFNRDSNDEIEVYDYARIGFNEYNYHLNAGINTAEDTNSGRLSLYSNGFKLQTAPSGPINSGSGGTEYLYMAWGQTPVDSNNVPNTAK